MLRLIRRWLGWEADEEFYGRANIQARARPSSATAHLFAKNSKGAASRAPASPRARQAAKPEPRPKPAPKTSAQPTPARPKPKPAATQKPRAAKPSPALKPRPIDAPGPQFDPYNTGKFDRSASWERISKNQR